MGSVMAVPALMWGLHVDAWRTIFALAPAAAVDGMWRGMAMMSGLSAYAYKVQ